MRLTRLAPALALLAALAPAPLLAASEPVTRMLDGVILPAFAEFTKATKGLDAAAAADCSAENPALREAYNTAFDAWIGVESYRAGPLETGGRGLAIAFWPDLKGAIPKQIGALLASGSIPGPEEFAKASVATRGFFALEAMLYDPAFNTYTATDPGCALTRAIAADLARGAAAVETDWRETYGPEMRTAGEAGNARFLADNEVVQLLFTATLTELEFISDNRIARPLGTADRPRPNRAEARLSGRSLRNVTDALKSVRAQVQALSGETGGESFDRLDYALYAAGEIRDPAFADVETPGGQFRLQELHDAVKIAREAVNTELTAKLNVGAGFNSLDGD